MPQNLDLLWFLSRPSTAREGQTVEMRAEIENTSNQLFAGQFIVIREDVGKE